MKIGSVCRYRGFYFVRVAFFSFKVLSPDLLVCHYAYTFAGAKCFVDSLYFAKYSGGADNNESF